MQREEDNKAIMHEMHQKVCRGNVRVRASACVCVRVRAWVHLQQSVRARASVCMRTSVCEHTVHARVLEWATHEGNTAAGL
jgi:hypothetical protein